MSGAGAKARVVGDFRRSGATLTIDLDAVRWNYRFLRGTVGSGVRCAAVVKADAYGLGVEYVAAALYAEGCKDFFVAHLDEGLRLRFHLPAASIFILNGVPRGAEGDCVAARLVPVLNSLDQCRAWSMHGRRIGEVLAAAVQLDSGMSRLGMTEREIVRWFEDSTQNSAVDIEFIMSHLACADTQSHPANTMQLVKFRRLAAYFPNSPRSLANSSGIFLGSDFHCDIVRPGGALFGINPVPTHTNPMRRVVGITAQVIQIRDADKNDHVGYGWSFRASARMRLATLSIGYADGLHRAFAKSGFVHFNGRALPVTGRVSMDTVTVDITALPPDCVGPGAEVEVIGDHQSIDDLAEAMGTIGYEVLAGLGHRYRRIYRGAVQRPRTEPLEELLG